MDPVDDIVMIHQMMTLLQLNPDTKPRVKPELLILHENNDNVSDLYSQSMVTMYHK